VRGQVQLDLFYVEVIHALGKQLGGSKQQVIATACVYMKRFCHVNSWCSVEPFLTALTCVYLATKVEEFGPISVKKILTAATRVVRKEAFEGLLPTRRGAQGLECLYVHADVIECEFVLVEEMGCCLVVFQPYRCLLSYASDAQVEKTLLPMAWNIVNDSLRSTACLTSPPYVAHGHAALAPLRGLAWWCLAGRCFVHTSRHPPPRCVHCGSRTPHTPRPTDTRHWHPRCNRGLAGT